MQMVINISQKDYEYAKDYIYGRCNVLAIHNTSRILSAIADGRTLPKGHGNLIDISNIDVIELEDSTQFIRHTKGDEVDVYISAPIIIEADRESEV